MNSWKLFGHRHVDMYDCKGVGELRYLLHLLGIRSALGPHGTAHGFRPVGPRK